MKNYLIILSVLLASCATKQPEPMTESTAVATSEPVEKSTYPLIEAVESAHMKADFLNEDAVQFDLLLFFGGKERMNATMTLSTDGTKGRFDYTDGHSLAFDNMDVFVTKDHPSQKGARFSAFTWSYFFLFPYKLSDPGTKWSDFQVRPLMDSNFDSGVLEFMPNTSDAPDDWYILYADTASHLVASAAYIVTAGGDRAEAEEDPHAISYDAYETINGVPIATDWKFWAWREGKGLTEQLGYATLSNVKFVSPDAGFYDLGAEAIKID